MKEKSIKKNALWAFIRAFFSSFFPLITFPYASRILLPEGIGQVNFANSINNYFIMLATLGIGTYGIRESSKLRDDKNELSKFVRELMTINFIASFISYCLLFTTLIFVKKTFEYRNLILVGSTNILFIAIGLEWFYKGIEEFRYITIRNFIFQCIGLIYLFIFVRDVDDTVHYIIFGLFTSVGSNIFNLIHSRKIISYKIKIKLELKKHIKPIFMFFGMSLITSVYEMLDTTMLGFLSNDTQIGYYSAANKLNMLFLRLITAATTVLLPRLAYYFNSNEKEEFSKITGKIFSITALFAIPICFGLYSLAAPLVLLFSGERFLPAVPTMHIIAPLIYIMSISDITGIQILPAQNKEKVSLISYIAGALTNVTINFILIPAHGSIGAAIGTLCAETVVMLIQVLYLRKTVFSKNMIINFIKVILASAIMYLVIYLLSGLITNIILHLICSFIAGVITYYIVLKLLKTKELKELESSLINKIRK